MRELMNFDYVQTLIREHLNQVHNHNHILWGLMNPGHLAPPVSGRPEIYDAIMKSGVMMRAIDQDSGFRAGVEGFVGAMPGSTQITARFLGPSLSEGHDSAHVPTSEVSLPEFPVHS